MSQEPSIHHAHKLFQERDFASAEALCRDMLAAGVSGFQAHQLIALIRFQQGRLRESEDFFAEALRSAPYNPELNFNYGNLLMQMGRAVEAIKSYEITVSQVPHSSLPLCNLGAALGSVGRITDSIAALRRALDIDPHMPEARQNLASNLMLSGLIDEAIPEFRKAISGRSGRYINAEIGLLFSLNLKHDMSRELVRSEHFEWGRKVSSAGCVSRHDFTLSREPDRPLRVGIVSSDLKEHSVAAFLEPLLEASDRRQLEFFAYSDTTGVDEVTKRLRQYFSVWRDMHSLEDFRWAELVRSDSIDILIDLGGHTTASRVSAFSLRPAPVQVSWLGYPNTTGLAEMDYRLSDEHSDPSGDADAFYSERLIRLPGGPWCYRPRDGTPSVGVRNVPFSAPIVYGSFNAVHKLNDKTLRAWGRILQRVPGSTLLLKAAAFNDCGVRELYLQKLEKFGVVRSRVDFLGYASTMSDHLASYSKMDICLDTYPYCGTTTTFEALHMGVPVVTQKGLSHASRVGMSILERLGRPEWIASDEEGYVEIATLLAADRSTLSSVRSGLRAELERSSLMDRTRFAADFSSALRQMWIEWCQGIS
jgi:predicted O-linked N-acetylglucosamine transferase (SPINDLY family)